MQQEISNDFGPGNFRGTKTQIHQCTMGPLQLAPFCWLDTDMFQSHGFPDPLIYFTYDFGWADISGKRMLAKQM